MWPLNCSHPSMTFNNELSEGAKIQAFSTHESPNADGFLVKPRVGHFLELVSDWKLSLKRSVELGLLVSAIGIIILFWCSWFFHSVFIYFGFSEVVSSLFTLVTFIVLGSVPFVIMRKQARVGAEIVDELKETPVSSLLPRVNQRTLSAVMPKLAIAAFSAGILYGLRERKRN